MMTSRVTFTVLALTAFVLAAHGTLAQQLQKESFPGITNFTRVNTTVACGGATTPEAIAVLRQQGFAAVINFRLASEPGANVEAAAETARAAGLKYIHIPFSLSSPDPAAAAKMFLAQVALPENQPVYIHCASANRVGAMWLIKRVLQDGWEVDKATAEAETIGLTNAALKQFALDYIKTNGSSS